MPGIVASVAALIIGCQDCGRRLEEEDVYAGHYSDVPGAGGVESPWNGSRVVGTKTVAVSLELCRHCGRFLCSDCLYRHKHPKG